MWLKWIFLGSKCTFHILRINWVHFLINTQERIGGTFHYFPFEKRIYRLHAKIEEKITTLELSSYISLI